MAVDRGAVAEEARPVGVNPALRVPAPGVTGEGLGQPGRGDARDRDGRPDGKQDADMGDGASGGERPDVLAGSLRS